MRDFIKQQIEAAASTHHRFANSDLDPVAQAVETIVRAIRGQRLVLAFGNGGSATDAQHFAAELVGRFMRERRALAALALSADSAVLTCLGNDYGFEQVFSRQIEALGKPGDVCIAISTSGESINVIRGLEASKRLGLRSIALTGRDGGHVGALADLHINVSESSTARIQEVHRTVLHVICHLAEAAV